MGGGGVATLIFSILGPRKTRRFSVQEGLVGVLVAYPELLLLGYCYRPGYRINGGHSTTKYVMIVYSRQATGTQTPRFQMPRSSSSMRFQSPATESPSPTRQFN